MLIIVRILIGLGGLFLMGLATLFPPFVYRQLPPIEAVLEAEAGRIVVDDGAIAEAHGLAWPVMPPSADPEEARIQIEQRLDELTAKRFRHGISRPKAKPSFRF